MKFYAVIFFALAASASKPAEKDGAPEQERVKKAAGFFGKFGDFGSGITQVFGGQQARSNSGCQTVHDEVWEERCSTEYEDECSTDSIEKCAMRTVKVCTPRLEQKCGFQFEERCTNVPVPECRTTTQRSCTTEQRCESISERVCHNEPKQICKTKQEKQCDTEYVKQCKQVRVETPAVDNRWKRDLGKILRKKLNHKTAKVQKLSKKVQEYEYTSAVPVETVVYEAPQVVSSVRIEPAAPVAQFRQECSEVPQERCVSVPREFCVEEPYETCKDIPRQVCHDEPRCSDVPLKSCALVQKQKCVKVPTKHCEAVPKTSCGNVQKRHCEQVPRTTCVPAPRKDCSKELVKKPRRVCRGPAKVTVGELQW